MKLNPTASLQRQQWLEHVVEALRRKFTDAGYRIPEKVRVSTGWPRRAASCGAIGECWAPEACSDKHAEVFISPEISNGAKIIDVLAHELVHASVGNKEGHGKVFKKAALAIGLEGPMRATKASPAFGKWCQALFKRIGPYPAGYLSNEKGIKKQSTRLLKCECPRCGYTVRVTRKWIEDAGAPFCPTDDVQFECA